MSRTINGTIAEMRARFPGSDYAAAEHFMPETADVHVYAHGSDPDDVRAQASMAGAPESFCVLVLRNVPYRVKEIQTRNTGEGWNL